MMEKGDIATWTSTRLIVVLEGILATPKHRHGRLRKNKKLEILPAEEWEWHELPLKRVVDYVSRMNVAVEVVTFMGPDVAEAAADFLLRYDLPVSSIDYADYDWFCQSLKWRPEVEYVIDSDPERMIRYGQRGRLTPRGADF